MAGRVGATHYTALTGDGTYSFDYGNSHFAVIDLPEGGSSSWTSSEINWLDADLSAAESRGLVHEFIFSHGPMYGVTVPAWQRAALGCLESDIEQAPDLRRLPWA